LQVANTGVRHMGTLAGNLMLKHAHNDFPSDVFVLLEAVGASIVTVEAKKHAITKHKRPSDWLKVGFYISGL
jgi:xanthine dehydrogenase/oxidase